MLAGTGPLAGPKEMLFACAVVQCELDYSSETIRDLISQTAVEHPNLVSSHSVLTCRFGSKGGSWKMEPHDFLHRGQHLSAWADVFDAVMKSEGTLIVVRLVLPSIRQTDDSEECTMDLSKALVAYCAVRRPAFLPHILGSGQPSRVG
jgi:hypothetical protein